MRAFSQPWALVLSQTIYRRLLRAYPAAHRAAYGPAMAQLFRDQCRDEWNAARGWGLTKLWLRVLPDLVSTSIREQIAALTERKSMNEKIASLSSDRTTPTAIFIRVAVVVFLITVLAATAITFILPESYASTARIKVESDATPSNGQIPYDPYFLQTTFEVIQSQLVLEPVILKLNLNVEWGKRYFAGETIKTSEALTILKGRLHLQPVRGTKLIAITVYSEDRNEAARIANAIAETYQDYRIKSYAELTAKRIETLQQQYQTQTDRLREVQTGLANLRQEAGASATAIAERERELAQQTEVTKVLLTKIETEKIEAQLPKTALVQIVDRAEPGRAPVRPNKTLDIFMGVVAGGIFGLLAGGAAALVAQRWGARGRNTATVA